MAPPKDPDQEAEVDPREFCRTCNAVFMSYEALHLHKLGAADHFCCPVCSADFVTAEGFKRHYNQMHAAQQNLECPGCGERFVRVGSLVSHIEMNMCRVISAAKFGDIREAKAKWHSDNHNATVFARYGAGFEGIDEEGNVTKPPNASVVKPKTTTGPAKVPRGPSGNAYEDAWRVQPHDEVAAHDARSTQGAWSSSDTDTGGARLALESTDLLRFESPEKRDGWVDDKYKPANQGIRAQPGPKADHLPLVVGGWGNGPSSKVDQSSHPKQENHKPKVITSQGLNETSVREKTKLKPMVQNDFPSLPSQQKQAKPPVAVVKLKIANQQSAPQTTWTTPYGTKNSLPPAFIPGQVAANPERTYTCKTCAEAFPGMTLPQWSKAVLEDHARKSHRLQDHEILELYPPEPERTYFCKLCTEAMPGTKFEKMTKGDLEIHGRTLHRLREHELHELYITQAPESSSSAVKRPVGEVPAARNQAPTAGMPTKTTTTTTNSQRPPPATSVERQTPAASSQRPVPTTSSEHPALAKNGQRSASTSNPQRPAAAAQLLKAPATTKPTQSPTPSPQPPAGQMQTVKVDEGEEWRPHDPSNPKFNVKSYWIAALEKYKCPHVGCKKSVAAPSAFIQHLRSPAHSNSNLQCMNCLRYFGSATALTQHCEAQTTRCLIRETENYGAALDVVTAGTAAPAGRHADDTVRYVTNNIDVVGGSQSFIQAHKKAQAVKEARNATYWDNKTPDW